MLVEIHSDLVCPWCYIGKARFARAHHAYTEATGERLTVRWLPFLLDPDAPAIATPALDVYARKFGGPERARRITDDLTRTAAADGLELRFDRALRANTIDAHRLMLLGASHGVADDIGEALMRAYFSEGRDLSAAEVLIGIASAAGIEADTTRAYLASDAGFDDVRAAVDLATAREVSGVPAFVIEGRWVIPGAQDPDTLLAMLLRARSKLVPAADGGA